MCNLMVKAYVFRVLRVRSMTNLSVDFIGFFKTVYICMTKTRKA